MKLPVEDNANACSQWDGTFVMSGLNKLSRLTFLVKTTSGRKLQVHVRLRSKTQVSRRATIEQRQAYRVQVYMKLTCLLFR